MSGYDGSGTFTKSINWTDDATNGIKIRADRHDTVDNEFISGFNLALCRDGQAVPTANLPMGNFRHTGVGNAVARTDYAAFGQVQDQTSNYGTTGGSSNAYTLTPTPAITAYTAGQRFICVSNFANTSAATINVSSLGAKNIYYDGAALSGGEIASGQVVELVYDGTQFNIISPISRHVTYSQVVLFNQVFS